MLVLLLLCFFSLEIKSQAGYYNVGHLDNQCLPTSLVSVLNRTDELACNGAGVDHTCDGTNNVYITTTYAQSDCGGTATPDDEPLKECDAIGGYFEKERCGFYPTSPRFVRANFFTFAGSCDAGGHEKDVYYVTDRCMPDETNTYFFLITVNDLNTMATVTTYPTLDCSSTATPELTQNFALGPATCEDDSVVFSRSIRMEVLGEPECGGVPSSSGACAGHGDCTKNDNCVCDTYYTDDPFCGVWYCDSLKNYESAACGPNGECVAHETCECKEGFTGDLCESWTCNDIANDAGNVCGGRGVCAGFDTCNCNSGYDGDNCESSLNAIQGWQVALIVFGIIGIVIVVAVCLAGIAVSIPIFAKGKKEEVRLSRVVESRRMLDSQLKTLRASLQPEEFSKLNMGKLKELQMHFVGAEVMGGGFDGKVTREELMRGYKHIDKDVKDDELAEIVDDIFKEADEDRDGVINFAEFYKFMTREKEMEELLEEEAEEERQKEEDGGVAFADDDSKV